MTKKQVFRRLNAALKRLKKSDAHLFQSEVNERSLTHKLAGYVAKEFPKYDVDVEYNRDHDRVKKLQLPSRHCVRFDDICARTVFPDIIVHRRGTDVNLLVIEVKKAGDRSGKAFDLLKLRAFREELRYKHAVFLQFCAPDEPTAFEMEFL